MGVLAAIAPLASSVAVILGGLLWVYRQGGQARGTQEALNRNESATTRLADSLEKLDGRISVMVEDHEKRLLRLEWEWGKGNYGSAPGQPGGYRG